MPFPNVSGALWRIGSNIHFNVISKAQVDFETDETVAQSLAFRGVLQPLNPQRLLVKPEGQRQWKWWTLWTKQSLELDWLVEDTGGRKFRVMSLSDWSSGQYRQYELVENPVL